jgi:hypothetical protein
MNLISIRYLLPSNVSTEVDWQPLAPWRTDLVAAKRDGCKSAFLLQVDPMCNHRDSNLTTSSFQRDGRRQHGSAAAVRLVLFCLIHSLNPRGVATAFQVGRTTAGDVAVHTRPTEESIAQQQQQQHSNQRHDPRSTSPEKTAAMQALSLDPPIFVSTAPLLSLQECATLSHHFRGSPTVQSQAVLVALQQRLDRLLGRSDAQPVTPRYLCYEPSSSSVAVTAKASSDWLLPDGLHVDTNNGFLFRYLTVLVYLSTTDSAPTTFPLAIVSHKDDEPPDESAAAAAAGQALLDDNRHHTRDANMTGTRAHTKVRVLEGAAWDLYRREQDGGSGVERDTRVGIRVLPQAGHCVAFFSINGQGQTHARSWHGSEILLSPKDSGINNNQKEVLTFFYEVPMSEFQSQLEFGQCVERRQRTMMEMYCSPA